MIHLELEGIEKRYGASVAVERVDLRVERGELVALLGPSGCGKTTTLRMIAGFETPSAGRIRIADQDVTDIPTNRRKIGMVFQSYALFPNMTAAENIGFGLKIARQSAEEVRQRVDEMLDLIGMQPQAKRYPYQLSGGQQQRVALARALAIRPQVLLLDEPLSALDAQIRVALRDEIRAIQRRLGITTIFVTHDQEEAMALADRMVVMNKGQVAQIGSPFAIYHQPASRFVAEFVGTLNLLRAEVRDAATGALTLGGQALRVGRPVDAGDGSISVALRPEALHIGGAAADGDNMLRGEVEDVMFLGAMTRLQVRVGQDLLSVDQMNDAQRPPPLRGASVELRFPPEAVLVME